MSLSLSLLSLTESRAPMICTYGGPGFEKTLAIRTLPAPTLLYDFEGGTGGLIPWIRRRRRYNEHSWIEYTQAQREEAFKLVHESLTEKEPIPPGPLIDVIKYEPLEYESYTIFTTDIGNFDTRTYNSLAIDSLQEFSQATQTFSKGQGNEFGMMQLPLWGGAQERAAIAIRRTKQFRDVGVFVYLIAGEDIDKDYAIDPRSLPKGTPPDAPYAIRGSVSIPGKLVGLIEHTVDIFMHTRKMNGANIWVARNEPIGAGTAQWQTKDRWGRLPVYNTPSFIRMCVALYGKEGARAIYQAASA